MDDDHGGASHMPYDVYRFVELAHVLRAIFVSSDETCRQRVEHDEGRLLQTNSGTNLLQQQITGIAFANLHGSQRESRAVDRRRSVMPKPRLDPLRDSTTTFADDIDNAPRSDSASLPLTPAGDRQRHIERHETLASPRGTVQNAERADLQHTINRPLGSRQRQDFIDCVQVKWSLPGVNELVHRSPVRLSSHLRTPSPTLGVVKSSRDGACRFVLRP